MPISPEALARDKLAQRLLYNIFFVDLWFNDVALRQILYESYVANVHVLNLYVRSRSGDLYEFYAEIERILLETPDLCTLKKHNVSKGKKCHNAPMMDLSAKYKQNVLKNGNVLYNGRQKSV